jgi:hypothetical protein
MAPEAAVPVTPRVDSDLITLFSAHRASGTEDAVIERGAKSARLKSSLDLMLFSCERTKTGGRVEAAVE